MLVASLLAAGVDAAATTDSPLRAKLSSEAAIRVCTANCCCMIVTTTDMPLPTSSLAIRPAVATARGWALGAGAAAGVGGARTGSTAAGVTGFAGSGIDCGVKLELLATSANMETGDAKTGLTGSGTGTGAGGVVGVEAAAVGVYTALLVTPENDDGTGVIAVLAGASVLVGAD